MSRYLPLTGDFELLRFRERQNFRTAPELGLVALRNEPVSMTAYRVEDMQTSAAFPGPDFHEQLQQYRANGTEDQLTQLSLELSASDREKLDRVTSEITGGKTLSVAEFADQASSWLERQHTYGLKSSIPPGGGDTLLRWLVSSEPGHCELFAGSLVLLARAADIPSRLVTGFRGGSWNGFSNNFTLRNSDAHAWCELFDETTQTWVRADPTPGANAIGTEETTLTAMQTRVVDRSWTARLDSLRIFWYRRIVNFDQSSQVETMKAVKSATQETGRRVRAWFKSLGDRVKAWLATPWDGRRLAIWLATLGLIGFGLWQSAVILRKLRRVAWRQRRGRLHPTRVEAGKWLKLLRGRCDEQALLDDLERLRYGAQAGWPDSERVITRARRSWHRVRRNPINRN